MKFMEQFGFPIGLIVGAVISFILVHYIYKIPLLSQEVPPPTYECILVQKH